MLLSSILDFINETQKKSKYQFKYIKSYLLKERYKSQIKNNKLIKTTKHNAIKLQNFE